MTPRRKTGKPAPGDAAGDAKAGRAPKPALSRESIIAAAMTIIDHEGYEALSMRRLGRELSVDPMAVYYHLPNKSALLDALVEGVMTEIDLGSDDPSASIEDRLINAARVYREALLAHPGLIQAVVNRPPRTPASLRPVEALLGIFIEAGFAPEEGLFAVNLLAAYVRGFVIREAPVWPQLPGSETVEEPRTYSELAAMLNPDEFPNLIEAGECAAFCGFETEFDRGSLALIHGLLKMYGKQRGGRSK